MYIFDFKIIKFGVNNIFQKVLSIFPYLIIDQMILDWISSLNWYFSSAESNYLCQSFIHLQNYKNREMQCINIGYNIVGLAKNVWFIDNRIVLFLYHTNL